MFETLEFLNDVYRVEIDISEINEHTMTDTGVVVGDLEPIGDCSLTPGNPSPIGRTFEGDLAYVVLPTYEYMMLKRGEAADLVKLLAAQQNITTLEDIKGLSYNSVLYRMIDIALPKILFPETGHGVMEYNHCKLAILTQGAAGMPGFLLDA